MNNIFKGLAVCAVGLMACAPLSAKQTESEQVRALIDKVNQHWQSENSPEVRAFWDNAAYHTGNMEAYRLTGNPAYYSVDGVLYHSDGSLAVMPAGRLMM